MDEEPIYPSGRSTILQPADPQKAALPSEAAMELVQTFSSALQRLLSVSKGWNLDTPIWNEKLQQDIYQLRDLSQDLSGILDQFELLSESDLWYFNPIWRHHLFNKLNLLLNGTSLLLGQGAVELKQSDLIQVMRIIVNSSHVLSDEFKKVADIF